MKALGMGLAALVMAVPAFATEVGVYVKGGTLGIGGGIGASITDSIRVRAGYTALNISRDISDTDVDYHGDLKLGGGEALLDWHPFNGTFRVTGGLSFSRNKITADGKPSGGTYTINDHTYTAAEIGSLDGSVKFKSTSPYLGIGWGDVVGKDGRFSFIADIGILFQGSPDASLHANCGSAVTPTQCAQIKSDVAEEERDLQDKADDYKYWPVLSLGVAYRF